MSRSQSTSRLADEQTAPGVSQIKSAAQRQADATQATEQAISRLSTLIDKQAEQIEPVVQSLAKLTKELRRATRQAQDAQEQQIRSWQESQSDAAAAMLDQKTMIDQSTADLTKVRAQVQKAARSRGWQTWVMVAMTALIAGSAPLIGFWLLVDGAVAVQEGQVWLRLR